MFFFQINREPIVFFQINLKPIVYCFLQIILPRRLMAHAPVKWCFTLIHAKTVL